MELKTGALISLGEATTNKALRRYFRRKPFIIHKDVGLRQVIKASRAEMTDGEWSYYISAAFDFVICNDDVNQSYELILEYDGRQHEESLQALKDSLKNRLCQAVKLPILRIGVEDVKNREDTTILEWVLEHYFCEKALEKLRVIGAASEEDEFFSEFDGTSKIRKALLDLGIGPPLLSCEPGFAGYWYRVLENGIDSRRVRLDSLVWEANVCIEVIRGTGTECPVLSIEKKVIVKDINPNYNVPGVHGWHIAIELAKYLCFKELLGKWKNGRI